MASFAERVMGAAKLDVNVFEEVESDTTATGQAMVVVLLSSLAAGIGAMQSGVLYGLVFTTIAALIGWFIWAFLTYFIGTKLLPEPQTKSDVGELLRVIGFANAPGVLRILGVIPLIGGLISFAIAIWILVAVVIAVRQALDYKSTGRAVLVCLIGWLVFMILSMILALMGLGGMQLSGGAV